jgi:hypothetical protein
MKKLTLTSDAPAGWCKVSEIKDELYDFEKVVLPLYADKFDYELGVCFRCLNKKSGWKSKRRFYKDENPTWLGLDMVVYEEELRPRIDNKYATLNKVEQRLKMGEEFMTFLIASFNSYKDKWNGIKEHGDAFLLDTKKWLIANFWLKNENNELEFSKINEFSFEKTINILGIPNQKHFEICELNKKTQLLVWDNIINHKIMLKYTLEDKVWELVELKINKINPIEIKS